MKNILITGVCGFIGSNFINNYFYTNNYNIYNIDALYYCANRDNILKNIRESDRYTFIKGNICSYDLINHILNTYKIDIIVHFAAQSHVQDSFTDSLKYTQDNILGTHILLEASRSYGKLEKFIHISTDEVYGESDINNNEQKTEQSVLCPTNPYAATKASAELIARSYYFSFKLPLIIIRSNNIYGPNQYPEKLIPRFINLLKDNKKVTIQGNGLQLRSFLHTKDISNAINLILEKGIVGEIYNIASSDELSVIDIAKILIEHIKNKDKYEKWEEYVEYIEDRPFNDQRYFINDYKIKELGWKKHIKFEDGIKELL